MTCDKFRRKTNNCPPFNIYQISDREKRQVMGDALFLIRLPTLTLDEFSTHAAKGNILHDREARDLFLLLAGSKPDRPIPFIAEPRPGSAQQIELTVTHIRSENITFPQGTTCSIQFQQFNPDETIKICEIQYCNPADFPIDLVKINTKNSGGFVTVAEANKIEKIPGKLMFGSSIYRAIFNNPVIVKSCSAQIHFAFQTKTYSGPGSAAYIQGSPQQTFQIKGRNISVNIAQHRHQSLTGLFGPQFQNQATGTAGFGGLGFSTPEQGRGWYSLVGLKVKI